MARQDPPIDLEIAREIVRYFRRCPQGADTVEGLVRWRLLDERIYRTVQEVDTALAWLVQRGLVVRKSMPQSDDLYLLNPDKPQDIEEFVAEPKTSRRPRK